MQIFQLKLLEKAAIICFKIGKFTLLQSEVLPLPRCMKAFFISVIFTKGTIIVTSWPRGYKTFFMLNSVEHEILNAHKYKTIKKFSFLGSDKPRMLFSRS